MTALSVEFDALERRLKAKGAGVQAPRTLNSGTVVREFRLEGRHASWTVHLAELGEGNSNAAVATQELLAAFGPDAALLVGIAGSLKADIVPGDVVVATKVYDIHGAREAVEGSGARPEAIGASRPLEQTARHVKSRIGICFKPIASGQVVLASPSSPLRAWLSSTYQDAGAIEMEGYGFCLAARHSGTSALVIRGISDNADGEKHRSDTNGDRERAAANAAEVAVAVLQEHQPRRTAAEPPQSGGGAPGTTVPNGNTMPDPPVKRRRRRVPASTPPGPKPPSGTTGTRTRVDWPRIWRKNKKALTRGGALVVVAAFTFVVVSSCHSDGAPASNGKTLSSGGLSACGDHADAYLRIAASVDKSESLRRAARAYKNHLSGSTCVGIVVDDKNSGEAMRALVDGWPESRSGGLGKPDVWAPAGSAWLSLARAKAKGENKKQFPKTVHSIVQSPLTVAMPKPMAKALDWPEHRFTWAQLAQWAKNADDFWADHGKPQWGAFKLGKTNPGYSTSGLNATIAAFFAATGTSGELGVAHLDKPANRAFVKSIEQAAVHYGDTTLTFLSNLREADRRDPNKAMSYISAVTLEESAVAAYNEGYPCGALSRADDRACKKTSKPDTPLVAFYPKDGVPSSDHPYIELTTMTSPKKAVADDFLAYLHSPEVYAQQFAPYGFRTHDNRAPTKSKLLTQAYGVLPQTQYVKMPLPKGEVLDRMLQVWSTLRRRANVLVVIDTSESMNDEISGTGDTKIERLKNAEPKLFGEFTGTDRVGLVKFSDADVLGGGRDYKELVPLGPFDEKLPRGKRKDLLADNVRNLEPEGATGLYDTLDAQLRTMREHYDPKAINAIVLLTDGRNEDNGSLAKEELLKRIGDRGKPQVRIFTIAYGSAADENDKNGKTVLQEIADASGGQEYDARQAKTIETVITSVISNF
ncbi:substrate-binding domain-containing protein [Streptomyces sp. NPDC005485]|uniref:phosphorylase family protein n=1 Tax=Streptomyces sp. NPDC005485 TaxID=3155591 RepID=UPI0033B46B8F